MAERTIGGGAGTEPAAAVERPDGGGAWIVLCDHASNRLPARYGDLGLSAADRLRHFAWDPGALGVARRLAERLDAPLVRSTVSRLVIDCNRLPEDSDAIVEVGETTPVPGNAGLGPEERTRRVAEVHAPYHAAVEAAIARRAARPGGFALCAVHTFTPVMRGVERPWHVGVIHEDGNTLAARIVAGLAADAGLVVGDNEPYAPSDRVYRTLERHGLGRGLPTVMIEIRNDLVADPRSEQAWGDRLADVLGEALREWPERPQSRRPGD